MTMTPAFRRLTLTTHITASVGWLGALAVFLAHAIASLFSQDEQIVRAASLAMSLAAWFVILPLSLASLITGLKLGPISYLADAGAEPAYSSASLVGLRTSILIHALGGLLVLLAIVTLAVYKPQGMTRYGVRKLREQGEAGTGSDLESVASTPPWVKVFGVIVILLILMVGVMLLGGGHGPGAHLSSGG